MVEADSGQIGGSQSAEFMALAEVGEDTIVYSTTGSLPLTLKLLIYQLVRHLQMESVLLIMLKESKLGMSLS